MALSRRNIVNRGDRPEWIDNFIAGRTAEWIIYDSQTQRLKTAEAKSQEEAIKIAISRDIVPRRTQDVIPRMRGHSKTMMSPEEFEAFMDRLRADA